MEFLEAPPFTALLPDYLSDEDYRTLQQFLARDPEAGDIIPETGGFRKLRWADPQEAQGETVWPQNHLLPLRYGRSDLARHAVREGRRGGPEPEREALKVAIGEEVRQRAARRAIRRK